MKAGSGLWPESDRALIPSTVATLRCGLGNGEGAKRRNGEGREVRSGEFPDLVGTGGVRSEEGNSETGEIRASVIADRRA